MTRKRTSGLCQKEPVPGLLPPAPPSHSEMECPLIFKPKHSGHSLTGCIIFPVESIGFREVSLKPVNTPKGCQPVDLPLSSRNTDFLWQGIQHLLGQVCRITRRCWKADLHLGWKGNRNTLSAWVFHSKKVREIKVFSGWSNKISGFLNSFIFSDDFPALSQSTISHHILLWCFC